MPQTYSPPATGVDNAAVTRAKPGIIVRGRHVFEPEEADPGIFDPAADIDRLLDPPALVDVAHQLDVGADRLAHPPHALDLLGGCGLAGQRQLRLHFAEALFFQAPGGGDDPVEREPAHQRAARIGRDPIARAAEQLPQRQVQRLAADVPQRHVERRQRQVEDAARPGRTGGGAQFGDDRLDAQRIVADDQCAQFVDRTPQRAGQRTAEISDADPDDPLVGLDLQSDDRAGCVRVFRGVGKRLVGRQGDDLRANAGNLHRRTPRLKSGKTYTPGPISEARSSATAKRRLIKEIEAGAEFVIGLPCRLDYPACSA